MIIMKLYCMCFFFLKHTTTTEISTLSLHDALPISCTPLDQPPGTVMRDARGVPHIFASSMDDLLVTNGYVEAQDRLLDRKSTRLNSSHRTNSYAVFGLKKKNVHQHYRNKSSGVH